MKQSVPIQRKRRIVNTGTGQRQTQFASIIILKVRQLRQYPGIETNCQLLISTFGGFSNLFKRGTVRIITDTVIHPQTGQTISIPLANLSHYLFHICKQISCIIPCIMLLVPPFFISMTDMVIQNQTNAVFTQRIR